MTTALAIRRSTILADARGGALSGLPYLTGARSSRIEDERVSAIASRVRVRVGVGPIAAVEVGGAMTTATAGVVYLVAAGVQGLFSYALFRGRGWVFENRHPIWGVIFALGTMSSLWSAGNKLAKSGSE